MARIIGKGYGTTYGTRGNDEMHITGRAAGYGLAGDDILYGDWYANKLVGGDGNDRAYGGRGDDALFGNAGRDFLHGEAGNDMIWGGDGRDFLYGGAGDDKLRGDGGNDVLNGGSGDDDLNGGSGNDTLVYEVPQVAVEGSSRFRGDAGNDVLQINGSPSDGSDLLSVGIFIDENGRSGTVNLNDGSDFTWKQTGHFSSVETFAVDDARLDYFGGGMNAYVIGSNHSDRFITGTGNETFSGRGGADEFTLAFRNGDTDRIIGFDPTEDVIVTEWWQDSQGEPTADVTITESGTDTIVTTSEGGTVSHTLVIDAIGIPLDVFKDGFSWDGFS